MSSAAEAEASAGAGKTEGSAAEAGAEGAVLDDTMVVYRGSREAWLGEEFGRVGREVGVVLGAKGKTVSSKVMCLEM